MFVMYWRHAVSLAHMLMLAVAARCTLQVPARMLMLAVAARCTRGALLAC